MQIISETAGTESPSKAPQYDELVPLPAQIACVEREIAKRVFVYPRWIEAHKMTLAKASTEIAGMRAVLSTLYQLERKERLI